MTKTTRILMGMPVTVEVVDPKVEISDFEQVFDYFKWVDEKFSTFKSTSEITAINEGRLTINEASSEMKKIFELAEKTKKETDGYFDMEHDGKIDPSGIVKGWAIFEAAKLLKKNGFENFYLDVGSDIQVSGYNQSGKKWRVGIRNPFKTSEVVKVVEVDSEGVATSGNYERGNHIYNPLRQTPEIASHESEILSLTVIGPNIYEADRFATAAFAMGKKGIHFLETLSGFEGYLIDENGVATMTTGFEKYIYQIH
jgi:thiamine biosynthesis lipoprotein